MCASQRFRGDDERIFSGEVSDTPGRQLRKIDKYFDKMDP